MSEYITIKRDAAEEFVEKRSRFIGYIKHVTAEEEAVEFINAIRSKHWDARHNVYAYNLRANNQSRYSDDGEPSGTAGQPVLSVLTKSETVDAVIVVTRYFGGILLGTGGLVRAYSHAAALALAAAEPQIMRECINCTLTCTYDQYGRISSLIPENGGFVDGSDFAAQVDMSFHMPPECLPQFEKKLADVTMGKMSVKCGNCEFFKI